MQGTKSYPYSSQTGHKTPSYSLHRLGVSGAIIFVIGLQAMATFRVLCPPGFIRPPAFLRDTCAPVFWPIMDYPMYWAPHKEGESIPRPEVVGVLEDGSEITIRPEDLNMIFWHFQDFIYAVDSGEEANLREYVELYEQLNGRKLTTLRLIDYPLVITRQGLREAAPFIKQEVDLGG